MHRDPEWAPLLVSLVYLALALFAVFDGIPSTQAMTYVFATLLSLIIWRLTLIDHALRSGGKRE